LILKGITWNHSRGITPLLATSQRFCELYPDVQVVWEKRSLQQFADQSLEALTKEYDLLIIDHPWVGCAAATNCVLPLDLHLPPNYLKELANHSVGKSHQSYEYDGHQWALSIDAATPAASYRTDIFKKENRPVPATWQEVLSLAKEGRVAVPAIPIDLLMNFYTFCIAHGQEPFQNNNEVINESIGIQALQSMRDLFSLIHPVFYKCNPILVAEMMSGSNDYWYCPFAYNYSNYSRIGYAANLLTYTDVVRFNNEKFRTTLGGTGMAVSAFGSQKEWALRFVQMICSPVWQGGEYVLTGGQPGYDYAWEKAEVNTICNDFFNNTWPTLNNAYLRPRYNGYLSFQDEGGHYIQEYLQFGKITEEMVLDQLNDLYMKSLEK